MNKNNPFSLPNLVFAIGGALLFWGGFYRSATLCYSGAATILISIFMELFNYKKQ